MARVSHSPDVHKIAFEAYCETHNWSEVARAAGASYGTVRRWADSGYRCTHGCPWHGWDRLEEERNAAHYAQNELTALGDFDPNAHDQAIRAVKLGGKALTRSETMKRTVRPDLERLAQWEYLWAKTFYTLTGQATQWSVFNDGPLSEEQIENMQATLRRGLTPTSFDQGVKALKMIQDQIMALKGQPVITAEDTEDEEREVSLAELKELRENLLNKSKRII